MPDVEQAEGGLEIGGRDRYRLADRAHRVVQPDAGVPDGVPQPVGQGPDVTATAIDQHQVEVAAGSGFPPAVPADRDQRDPGLGAQQPVSYTHLTLPTKRIV